MTLPPFAGRDFFRDFFTEYLLRAAVEIHAALPRNFFSQVAIPFPRSDEGRIIRMDPHKAGANTLSIPLEKRSSWTRLRDRHPLIWFCAIILEPRLSFDHSRNERLQFPRYERISRAISISTRFEGVDKPIRVLLSPPFSPEFPDLAEHVVQAGPCSGPSPFRR